MDGIAKVYIVAFLICAVIGFKTGFSEANSNSYLQTHVFDPVELECQEENNQSVCELVYSYQKNEVYRWNVQTNVLNKSDYWNELQLKKISSSDQKFPINGDTIAAFLGGATAGITIKDFLEQKLFNSKSKIVVCIFGAVSGYSIGYKIGLNFMPGIESDEAQSILNDEKQWKSYEETLLKQIAKKTYDMASEIEDENLAEFHKKEIASSKWIREEEMDPNSSDFFDALNKYHIIKELLSKNYLAPAESKEPEIQNTDLTESKEPEIQNTDLAESKEPEIQNTDLVESKEPEIQNTNLAESKEPEIQKIKKDDHVPFWLSWWTISAFMGFTLVFLAIVILKQERVGKVIPLDFHIKNPGKNKAPVNVIS